MRNGTDPDRFQKELRRKLEALGVSSQAIVTLGKRRTIRIKDKDIVGYEVVLEGLSAEESLAIQENQPPDPALRFARTRMGCGVFTPINLSEERS
jgi:CRISPR-associated protein Cas6